MIFFAPVIVKHMEKNLDITKPLYGAQILPIPWPFVISRFHYMPYILPAQSGHASLPIPPFTLM